MTQYQRHLLERMRNGVAWCLPERTKRSLLRQGLVKYCSERCREHGLVRMVVIAAPAYMELRRAALAQDGGEKP